MKIGVIGSGNIGGTVGKWWAQAGHEVFFSSRHPEQLTNLVNEAGENAQRGTPVKAAQFGEVIFLAVNYVTLDQALDNIRPHLDGKIVLDATNPYGVTLPAGETAGTVIRGKLPNSKVVRVFNPVPARALQTEAYREGEPLAISLVADDDEAQQLAIQLVADAGYVGVSVGTLEDSPLVDPGGLLWVQTLTEDALRERLKG